VRVEETRSPREVEEELGRTLAAFEAAVRAGERDSVTLHLLLGEAIAPACELDAIFERTMGRAYVVKRNRDWGGARLAGVRHALETSEIARNRGIVVGSPGEASLVAVPENDYGGFGPIWQPIYRTTVPGQRSTPRADAYRNLLQGQPAAPTLRGVAEFLQRMGTEFAGD
jgi:hypothetical protein